MEISAGQMKQTRMMKMRKGVVAAALAVDQKFRRNHGEPLVLPAKRVGELPRFSPSSPYRTAMITLTYRDDGMWKPDHISGLVQHYRMWFKTNGKGEAFHYVWVIEHTAIGRPHYHMIVWLPKGVRPPLPDDQGWWPHGMTQAKYAVSPVGYLAKYASKEESKSGHHLPPHCRLWGYGGLRMDERGPVAMALSPRWLKSLISHDCHPVKKVYERVVETITYAGGFIHKNVIRKAGWFIKSGYNAGRWFFGPFECAGFTGGGIALSHRGVVEMIDEYGGEFFISHKA